MKEIINRLKSPVVIIQILSIIMGVITYFAPGEEEAISTIIYAVIAIINVFARFEQPYRKKSILI